MAILQVFMYVLEMFVHVIVEFKAVRRARIITDETPLLLEPVKVS